MIRPRCSGQKCLLLSLIALVGCSGGDGAAFGRFEGTVQSEWITPDREMRLLGDFKYIDGNGKSWLASKDSIIDGASIPRVFWTLIGSPFVGEHRSASVVHDVACVEKTEPWNSVHRMFYDACRCGGVGETRAKIMYAAVYHFGPRWERPGFSDLAMVTEPDWQVRARTESEKEKAFSRLRQFCEESNPSLEEIESFMLVPQD